MPPLAIPKELFRFLLHMHKNTHTDKVLTHTCPLMNTNVRAWGKNNTHTPGWGSTILHTHFTKHVYGAGTHTHTHSLSFSLSVTHVIMEANNSLLLCFTPNQWRNQYTCWDPCVVQNGTWTTENIHIKKTRLEAMHQRTQGQNTVLLLYIHIETNWEDGMKMWILNSVSMQNWPVFRHNVNNINMRHTNTKLDKADTCWEQYQHRHIGSPNLH